MLPATFFDHDACLVAKSLLGKIIRHKYQGVWLSALIIETEAYYAHERGSHASLGFTEKRKALFMPPGTIYMYYARGGDSLNVSCQGEGNAVLIKSAHVYDDAKTDNQMHSTMQQLNPLPSGALRRIEKLCSGQTLLCHSMAIRVRDWDQKSFNNKLFYFDDASISPQRIIQTTRLGIPAGRDEHLPYRYIDYEFAKQCTSNPLTKRGWREGIEYRIVSL